MLSRHPGHWVCNAYTSLSRAVKTGRRVADHASVESVYSAFSLKCSFASAFLPVSAIFAITGWVVNRINNCNRAERVQIKLNAHTLCDTRICLNLLKTSNIADLYN